jgi:hypothetical protein
VKNEDFEQALRKRRFYSRLLPRLPGYQAFKRRLRFLSETFRDCIRAIPERSQAILEHSKTILEHSKTILEHSKTILEHSKTILERSKTILE